MYIYVFEECLTTVKHYEVVLRQNCARIAHYNAKSGNCAIYIDTDIVKIDLS